MTRGAAIIDPSTGVARYIPDIELLRRNCLKIVMTEPCSSYWCEWAARQLYAMGDAPKLLPAPRRSAWLQNSFVDWVTPSCTIELRFNDVQPPTAEDQSHVFEDGASYQDILDAAYAAWLAHDPILVCEIAERHGLYWHALLP